MKRFWKHLIVATLFAGLCLRPATAAEVKPAEKAKTIDLVVCLDTSNSMDGLINSARAKLWDIVNDLARAQPTPNLRVALYSYGNDSYKADQGWVRKELDLTNDLDELYKKLFALTTNGGTEYHTRVCKDAVEQQKWSEAKDALKIIFVCGNEAAAQDPVVSIKEAAAIAKAKGVVVNTIYCGGPNDGIAPSWKLYATEAGGRFISINQEQGVVAIVTPLDKDLAELSAKLNETYVVYGGKKSEEKQQNQVAQDYNAAKSGSGVAASRAVSKSTGLYCNDAWDLVDRCKTDAKFDIKKIPEAELNEHMRKMKPEEREKYVKEMAAKRDALQKQIQDVNTKRTAYVAEQAKKNPTKGDKAFDDAVRDALREQAETKGITIPK